MMQIWERSDIGFSNIKIKLRNARQHGFTLIEIMLTLVIIGVVVGMVSISYAPNPAAIIDREARRLQALLTLASEEAVLQGEELALAVSTDPETGSQQYQILRLDKQSFEWQAPHLVGQKEADKFWAVHTLHENIDLALQLDGDQISQQQLEQIERMRALVASDALLPSILLLSSGEITPFSLRLTHRDSDYAMSVTSDGFSGVFLQ